jgi:hypothetical protein
VVGSCKQAASRATAGWTGVTAGKGCANGVSLRGTDPASTGGGVRRDVHWEIRMAWVLRAAIAATAIAHLLGGDPLYGLFCIAAVVIVLIPAAVAKSSLGNLPIRIELAVLWIVVADMTLGQLGGLYLSVPWYDKALHLGNSALLGMVAFLAVYMLHFIGRSRQHPWVDGAAILLLTLGLGALWEIGEYAIDQVLGRATQGAPGMGPLDDTMWDLILDGSGGLLGALFGPLYMHHSRESRRRIERFARLIERRGR